MGFKYILLLFCFVSLNLVTAQVTLEQHKDVGFEVQQYPTGFLLGIKAEFGLKPHHAIEFRIGYNSLNHKDFGVQDSEIGGGFGGSLGYRYYFNPNHQKLFCGVRSDIWFNKIDWINIENASEGETSIIVFQPTVILGYSFILHDHFVFTPTLAFGAEINIKTEGEPVGEGGILLWGVNFLYRF